MIQVEKNPRKMATTLATDIWNSNFSICAAEVNTTVSFEIKKCESSNSVLCKDHFSYIDSLVIPCAFYDGFFYL